MKQYYLGILLHSDLENGRLSGEILLEDLQLTFQQEIYKYSINYSDLHIELGGSNQSLVFLKNKKHDTLTLYTSDKSILKNPIFQNFNELREDIKKCNKHNNKTKIVLFSILFLVLGGIASLYFSKNYFIEKLANQVPRSWEKSAGDHLFTSLTSDYIVLKNDSIEQQFRLASKHLLSTIEKEHIKIDLYFIKEPSINAFALPGGKVVIQSGLIEKANSWEEVLGVLSHELAHVTRRHHLRGVINNIGLFTVISALVGDVSALAGTFANIGGELASLSNSREFELEADETGWNYLVKSRVNPEGLISFFETLQKEEKGKLSSKNKKIMSFLSTHPDTKERINTLKNKKTNVSFPKIAMDYNAFKQLVKRATLTK